MEIIIIIIIIIYRCFTTKGPCIYKQVVLLFHCHKY